MGDKNLSVLFVDDPREWFFKKKVRDYITWRKIFSYTLPNLLMNGQRRSCGLYLYNINTVDFPKETNGELLTAVLGPMTVITVDLLTTSRMNLGAEKILTPGTASNCTRVKESTSAFILAVAMVIYIMVSCNFS